MGRSHVLRAKMVKNQSQYQLSKKKAASGRVSSLTPEVQGKEKNLRNSQQWKEKPVFKEFLCPVAPRGRGGWSAGAWVTMKRNNEVLILCCAVERL